MSKFNLSDFVPNEFKRSFNSSTTFEKILLVALQLDAFILPFLLFYMLSGAWKPFVIFWLIGIFLAYFLKFIRHRRTGENLHVSIIPKFNKSGRSYKL